MDITLSQNSHHLILHYSDDGPGVAEDMQEHIFEPFYTSCPGDANSTGLGLFVIYNLCKQLLGADIEIQPQPGFNLKFTFPLNA